MLAAIPHHPIDVVLAFPDLEHALEICVSLRVVLNFRNGHPLREKHLFIRMCFRRYPEDHRELVARARKLPKRNRYVVSGVEPQVESESWLNGRNIAGKIFANLLRFQ